MNYRHLLVPVGLDDSDPVTIDTALDLAQQHQASTTLMYVIEAIDAEDDDDESELSEFFAEIETDIRRRLMSFVQRFEQAGLAARVEVLVGHGPREIVQYSASESVDLVVMRSERVDLSRPFENVTSVSHQVSLFCQCPVMLLK